MHGRLPGNDNVHSHDQCFGASNGAVVDVAGCRCCEVEDGLTEQIHRQKAAFAKERASAQEVRDTFERKARQGGNLSEGCGPISV